MKYRRDSFVREIDAFDTWISRMITGGRSAYFLNFMFRQLPESRRAKNEIMKDEVCRVYAMLVTREVRRPRSLGSKCAMPRFFGCPDLPVPKRDKHNRRLVVANEGMHFNGVLVLSPFGRGKLDPEHDLDAEPYVRSDGKLERIDVTPIEYGSMAHYTFKTIERGGDWDDILILPRSSSELSERRSGSRSPGLADL
ncbi:hypothetical protein ACVIN2_006397 [Bradyrhizobium sp. USDA 3650]